MPYTLNNGASLGVPIETETTLPTHQPSRNTVAECYRQVIDDMTGALDLSALSTGKKMVILMCGVSRHYFHVFTFT